MVDGGAMITMDQRRRRHAPADGEDGAVAGMVGGPRRGSAQEEGELTLSREQQGPAAAAATAVVSTTTTTTTTTAVAAAAAAAGGGGGGGAAATMGGYGWGALSLHGGGGGVAGSTSEWVGLTVKTAPHQPQVSGAAFNTFLPGLF
jgi:hypothetical protein